LSERHGDTLSRAPTAINEEAARSGGEIIPASSRGGTRPLASRDRPFAYSRLQRRARRRMVIATEARPG
jgi:hypothetical protein